VDTERYLELKDLKDNGNGLITYHIVHATPPPAPICTPAPFTDPNNPMPLTTTFSGYSSPAIFLPPLTRSTGSVGHAGQVTYNFCSAGSAGSITAFMATAIPAAGWSAGNGPYPANIHSCAWHLTDNVKQITYCINNVSATDPKDWIINTSSPM
jgi:hypothetical protein